MLRTKSVEQLVAEAQGGGLRRSLTLTQLTMISIGATLGTGIFVVMAEAAPLAGPAVILSFALAAVTALFSALSYAELAGTVPVAGSSYSYAYATLGELVAWVCGWCLLLEYAVSVSAVAVGWGEYLGELGRSTIGITLPDAIAQPPGEGGLVNVPAVVVVALAAILLIRGVAESAVANAVMVIIKVGVLVFFCVVGFSAVKASNFTPFAPLGVAGISAAGAKVFFSYIGFDAASTAGEEARNPRRDLPLAILISLAVTTVVYMAVAFVAVGVMPWQELGETQASLAAVLRRATGADWPAAVLSFAGIIAIASVVLTVLYGQTRILLAMSRDGLLPPIFRRVHPRTGTPVANTLLVSGFVALLAAVVPLGKLVDATSIGTLFAFALVNVGVIVLRRSRPGLPRTFRTPLFPVTPLLGAAFCGYLMVKLDAVTWLAFLLWMAAGLLFYLLYGYRHARANTSH